MNKYIFPVMLLVSMASPPVQCAEIRTQEAKRAQIESLVDQARQGNTNAIGDLATVAGSNAVPVLEVLAGKDIHVGDPDKHERKAALEALIKLNAETYFEEKIKRVTQEGGDDYERMRAFDVLERMNTKNAVRTVAQFLYDTSRPPQRTSDVIRPSNRLLAAFALGRMIPDNPPPSRHPNFYTGEDIPNCIEWWEKTKGKYEEPESSPNQRSEKH